MASNLTDQVRNIATVCTAVANGDLILDHRSTRFQPWRIVIGNAPAIGMKTSRGSLGEIRIGQAGF